MMSLRLRATLVAIAMAGAIAACSSTWVVVPPPADGYSASDTLRGYLDGDEVRVVFRFDTITSTRVVTHTDTVFTEGADTVFRVQELLRVDTVTVTDTIRTSDTLVRIDSILRVDTVFRPDTVRLATTDTVIRTDTVTVTIPGRRFLFVPPGHYPSDGECRVWIHGVQPGQQARAAPCDSLGPLPARAFILFGGDAWDFDYDWLAAVERGEDAPPPEILALKRKGQGS